MNFNGFVRIARLGLTTLAFFLPSITEATLVTSWTADAGSPTISGANTSTVVIGTAAKDSAAGVSISGSLSGNATLAAIGDMIQVTGTMTLAGSNNGSINGDLSFGLYSTNGSSTANGWLGYGVSESDSSRTGSFYERNSGNTSIYTSTTGTTSLATTLASGSPAFSDGTYNFSLTLTLQAANTVGISYSLTRTSTTGYTISGSFTDTTPLTLSYNRVGFLAGSNLKADQFTVSNTDVTFVPIPEPGSAGLLLAGGFGLVVRRRR